MIENISDHLACILKVKDVMIKNNTLIEVEYRDMSKQGIDRLKEELHKIDWNSELPDNNSLDDNMTKFKDLLQSNCDHFLPLKQSKIKASQLRKEPWVTSGLLKSIKREKTLYKHSISSNATEKSRKKYKEYNLILRKVKRHAKKCHYIDNCVKFKDNTKQLWKVINRILNKQSDKTTVIPYLTTEKIRITKDQEIADQLGKYFSQVGKTFARKVGPSKTNIDSYLERIRLCQKSIFLNPTSEDEVKTTHRTASM